MRARQGDLSRCSDSVGLFVVDEAGGGWAVRDVLGHCLGDPCSIWSSLFIINTLYSGSRAVYTENNVLTLD